MPTSAKKTIPASVKCSQNQNSPSAICNNTNPNSFSENFTTSLPRLRISSYAPPVLTILQPQRGIPVTGSSPNDLVYEAAVFGFAALALFLQLLHIYRTVWWLPQSYTRHTVKLYLINPNLIPIFGLAALPRLLWMLLKAATVKFCKQSWQPDVLKTVKVALITTWVVVYCCSYVRFLQLRTVVDTRWVLFITVAFTYPILLYIITQKSKGTFDALLELVPEQPTFRTERDLADNAEDIRKEADLLRKDFNERLQRVLFQSFVASYTATIVPCLFTQNYVLYDVSVIVEHALFTFVGCFTMNAVQAFPMKYCCSLHHVAKYMGSWTLLKNSENALLAKPWCPKTAYVKDSVVFYNSLVFESRNEVNASVPGNVHDFKFQALFGKPGLFQAFLLLLQLLLVLVQFIFLLKSNEWHQMISLTFLQAASCFALFHLIRDCVIVRRVELSSGLVYSRNLCQ